ncbi:MAG: Kelch repeat-containing protein, partial [Bacteroidia bacterium]
MKTKSFFSFIFFFYCTIHLFAQGNWKQKANFGGIARSNAAGFSIGTKGYIGTGSIGTSLRQDFWEYDPATDSWTQKADFGGGARLAAVGFSIDTFGYIGTGFSSPNGPPYTYYNDFWEYNPTANTWIQKASFSVGRYYAVGFSIGSKGYIGTGSDGSVDLNDFWQYDPMDDSWTQKANFGGTVRAGAAGFSIGALGYIGTGFAQAVG